VAGGDVVDLVQAVGPWAGIASVVLLGLRSIATGAWVPRTTLDVLTVQWEARLKESNSREQDWRAAFQASDAARDVADRQLQELMVYARNADHILQNLPLGKDSS
jgi:hypothetical protein